MVRGMREVGQKPSIDCLPLYWSSWGVEGQENRDGVSGDSPELSLQWDRQG